MIAFKAVESSIQRFASWLNFVKALMFQKSLGDLRRSISLYHVWIHQAYHDVSSKYKRTVLGSIWISGGMVATSVALAIVMGGIQGQNLKDVLPYVMAGIMCFSLAGGYILSEAPDVYIASAYIIRNHAYPYTYYTFESLTRTFLIFLHNIVVIYIVCAVLGRLSIPHWSIAPGLIVVYLNSILWGSLVSMLAARFSDIRFLLPFISQIVFFLTPVFWYPTPSMQGWRRVIIDFNPFYGLTEIVRMPLLGQAPSLIAWELSLGSLGVGAVVWLVFFTANRAKIAFWV